ncbi:MAG TPA: hypothetical protein VLI54_01395 [Bacillota bacterium]|nr:hypothetical protein [Bacillota bacterium]
MRTVKSLLVSAGAVFVLAAAPVALVAADQSNPQLDGDAKAQVAIASPAALTDCQRRSAANGAGQDIFLSTASPKTYTGTAWQNVDCTSTTFRLSAGQRALAVVDFNAEADCNGEKVDNGQWCQTRALLNGSEGAPVAAEPSSFAFDSVAGGSSNWQAHSMGRAWEIRCGNADGCQYKFAVQTRMHDATVTGMWLDEIAAHLTLTYGAPAPL